MFQINKMKQIYSCLFIGLFLISCQKEDISPVTYQKSFSDSAIAFLKEKLAVADFNVLDVNSFQVLQIKNQNTAIKFFETANPETKGTTETFILLKRIGKTFTGQRVTIAGVSTSKKHTGFILLETLEKRFIQKYIVINNKVTNKQSSATSRANAICDVPEPTDAQPTLQKHIQQKIDNCQLPEVVITAYVSSGSMNFYSLYWMSGQSSSYYYYYTPGYGGGSVSGGSNGSNGQDYGAVAAPEFSSPDKPISNVKDEVKCFNDNATSTYTITVNVNQPVPGKRDVFEPLEAFPVGHTYFTLQQKNPDGSSITRNIGFYPKNSVKPGSATDVGTFGEDSNTPFDVSLKISVSGADFITFVNTIISQQRLMYDLDNFNCTNSAIYALQSINMHLPETKSNNVLFSGNNPADLGEDIKNLNLDKFSADNGGRKVVRSQSADNSQKPPAKAGGC